MKKGNKGGIIAIAVLLVVALAVNIACASLNPMITSWMGANLNPMLTGNKANESAEILSVADATEQSLKMAQQLEAEGIILLKNDNAALPMASGTKVNLFGFGSIDPIYGGTGSGSGDTSKNVDIVKGLQNAGLIVNDELVKFYQNSGVSRPKQGGYTGSNFTPAEVPASAYTDAVLSQAKGFSDVAVVLLSRIGGEGGDLPMDMFAAGYSKTDDGRHYLELTQDEEDLLNLIKSQNFGKVIVLINSSNAMELGFAEDGIDACVWVGSPGAVGFNAVGEALTGAVNPSGRLVDTYAYDLTSSPAYWNAGEFTYSNIKRNYVEYAEGIYVGYRYYETAAADGFIDYEKTVQYPFGYGLSYTTFQQEIAGYSDGNSTIAMQVKVTNTGAVSGKDVVQIYYTAPYTKGGIEKAHVALIGFAKTKELAPNESETVTVAFKAEDMASFDAFGAGCYVLEAGDYEIKLMNNAHDVIDSRIYTVKETVVYGEGNVRSTDKTAAVAHFADVQNGQITVYMSRSDWAGTTPSSRVDGKAASDAVVKAFSEKVPYETNASDPAIVYADNGLTLTDMAGLDWDDPKWELLLQQLSDEDMTSMILNGGWSTPAVASVGKPATSDLDGPAGINSLVSSLRGVSFPSEVVIGSTWNEPLVEEFGKVFGQEAAANGVVGLYAPGMNIHRTPFSGRNFEYYSEDGLLSGKLGAAEVRGAGTQGVYLYAKHFALNDQESNRLSISVWANEQAIRELYLKPFELTVKEGKTTAIMSSYSHLGTTWAGASKALLTDVLRGEWGFIGMVVTDSAMGNTSWMDPNLAVRAGNDMMLCLMGASIDSDNNTARNAMRAACHNILFTQANSAAVQVEADNTPYWYALVALFNAIVLTAIVLIVLKLVRKGKKLGVLSVIVAIIALALSALLVWFGFIKPAMANKSAAPSETAEPAVTEAPEENKPAEAQTEPKPEESAADAVAPEKGMELYSIENDWLGCRVMINADGTYRISYDYTEDAKDIEAEAGTWERVSDTELTLNAESGNKTTVTLADGKWSCEIVEPNTSTVCHPFIETAPASAVPTVSPEEGMELYSFENNWLGCRIMINADGTYRVSYDYTEDAKDIEAETGTWERVSDTELTLNAESGNKTAVTLADGKWSCEIIEPNTSTVCHPFIETAPALAVPTVSPEEGMELYSFENNWLGCRIMINADGTYRVSYDYTEDAKDIEAETGTWERISNTELTLSAESGNKTAVTLADGKWSCEIVEPNTSTVCHPFIEAGTASPAASTEVKEMELYDFAEYWLGCHVYLNADKTFSVTYDYTEDAKGIENMKGTWEQLSATEIKLTAEDGTEIPVTVVDGSWTCELVEPNTSIVCHPKAEGAVTAEPAATEPEIINYTIVYTDSDGTVYQTIETTDATVIPEIDIPVKEGFLFAGWQTRPDVTADDLVLGVSPYEVPAGSSSLYGGAGTAFAGLESFEETTLTLYPRWVAPIEIHSGEELKSMRNDLMGWYILANDIDLSGESWQPVGMYFSNYETVNAPYWTYSFRGTFDGAGHTISNLMITVDGCKADMSAFEGITPVWRNDGTAAGSESAFFGATAKATIQNVSFEKPVITVSSDNDATPYAAVVAGFDLASTMKNINVKGAVVTVTAGDASQEARQSAWSAVSAFLAGGWSTSIENCTVTESSVTLNAVIKRSHGGEFYVGTLLGEGYANMDGFTANGSIQVDVSDESTAEKDSALIVNVGGMGGTNTAPKNGTSNSVIDVKVHKSVGEAVVSIGGLTGSHRYAAAENNVIRSAISTDCELDPEKGTVYVGKVIGSTNVPYCIVQLIFAQPGDVTVSGCINNDAIVTHNGEEVTRNKGEQLMVNGEPLAYIANGNVEANGVTYVSNINDVIATYGSAVPASFLQQAVIVLVDR